MFTLLFKPQSSYSKSHPRKGIFWYRYGTHLTLIITYIKIRFVWDRNFIENSVVKINQLSENKIHYQKSEVKVTQLLENKAANKFS